MNNYKHSIDIRIYYEDTDAEGVVYYANYLKFAERGRVEFLRSLGIDLQQVFREHDLYMVVRRVEADYLAPARLDELVTVTSEVTECKNSSFIMTQTIHKDGKTLCSLAVTCVAVGAAHGKPVRLPNQIKLEIEN
ncbi:MAG: tol-pal system-associated acyl-CoA thioesterase [Alphaproteobacteria bacterium]|nr:tol-pal system-associated acyl-CoA thioesterase [Alphaproteobacteria bacterium]